MCEVNTIVSFGQMIYEVFHLFFVCSKDILQAIKGGDIACLRSQLLVACLAVIQGDFQDLGNIKECGVMPALCLMRTLRLHAPDDTIASGIRQGYASVTQCGNDDFVVIHGWHTQSQAGHFARPVEEFIRCVLVNTDGEGRCGQRHMGNCFHTHVGNIVGCVQSVFCLTAYDQILEHCVSCKCLGGNLVSCLIDVI